MGWSLDAPGRYNSMKKSEEIHVLKKVQRNPIFWTYTLQGVQGHNSGFNVLITILKAPTLQKNWSFSLRISSVNVTKSAENFGFGHIYWRNP